MPYPAKLIYKCAMSYKLTFFVLTNLRRIRKYFKSFNQENLATKSIYQKYKKKILVNHAFNLRKKQKYC